VLVRQCLEGDREVFGTLMGRYQKAVFNVALRMTRSYQEAQDITQAIFIQAYEKLGEYDARHKFFSWIYRMAVNESLNFIKRSRRFEGLDSGRDYGASE
jgi:RNA polymerase sigma-70 factor (ECF subfamily)